MSEKHLMELPWKTLVVKQGVKDIGLGKALVAYTNLDATKEPAKALEGLKEITELAAKLKKANPTKTDVVAHLDEVVKEVKKTTPALEAMLKSVIAAAAAAGAPPKPQAAAQTQVKPDVAPKPAPPGKSAVKEKEENEDEETEAAAFKKDLKQQMVSALAQVKARAPGDPEQQRDPKPQLQFMAYLAGKNCAVVVARKVGSPTKKLLPEIVGGIGGGQSVQGECIFEKNAHTFVLAKVPGGLAKKLATALQAETGQKYKVRVRSIDGSVTLDSDTDVDPDAVTSNGGPTAPPQPSVTYEAKLAALMLLVKKAADERSADVTKYQRLLEFAAGKAKSNDFVGAVAALRQMEQLLDNTRTKSEGGTVDAGVAFKARMTALIPKIKEAQTAGNARALDAKAKATEAGMSASKRDFGRAAALLDEVEQLLDTTAAKLNPLFDLDSDDEGDGDPLKKKPEKSGAAANTGTKRASDPDKAEPEPSAKPKPQDAGELRAEDEVKPQPQVQAEPKATDLKAPAKFDPATASASQKDAIAKIRDNGTVAYEATLRALATLDGGRGTSIDPAHYPVAMKVALAAKQATDKAATDVQVGEKELKRLTDAKAQSAEIDEAQVKLDRAKLEHEVAKKDFGTALRDADRVSDQRALLNEFECGVLAPDAKPKLSEAQVVTLVEAFGKSPAAVKLAFRRLATVKEVDRDALIAHVGRAVHEIDKLAPGDDMGIARDRMARNAVQMGATFGADYVQGFAAYYDRRAASLNIQEGDTAEPLSDKAAESRRLATVATNRTAAVAGAMLDEGRLALDSVAAKDAIGDLMFHPASLNTFTPEITKQVLGFKKLCEIDAKSVQDQLDKCTKPATMGAQTLVRAALGLSVDAPLNDKVTRKAVISGMLSPIAQGEVGSCASTAPLVAERANEPIRTMERLVEIASQGSFTPTGKDQIPANTRFTPDTGNALTRSLEFSVATASMNAGNTFEQSRLTHVVTGREGDFGSSFLPSFLAQPGAGLLGVDNVPWANANTKMTAAAAVSQKISAHLRVAYDAAGGSGDGSADSSSTKGVGKLHYIPDLKQPMEFRVIETEGAFRDAMGDIALATAGKTKESEDGQKILASVKTANFERTRPSDTLEGQKPYKPWEMGVAPGFLEHTSEVLSGKKYSVNTAGFVNVQKDAKGKPDSARVEEILDSVMARFKSAPNQLTPMSTQGTGAQHGFNFMRDAPGRELISDPNTVASFRDAGRIKVTTEEIPAAKVAEAFQTLCRRAITNWAFTDTDEISELMARSPTTPMTLNRLKSYAKAELQALKQKMAEGYVQEQKVLPNQTKREAELRKSRLEALDSGLDMEIDTVLLDAIPLDYVVIADTNWGGPGERVFFVVAPDLDTGDLRLWKRKEPDGVMSPADTYALAAWQDLETTGGTV